MKYKANPVIVDAFVIDSVEIPHGVHLPGTYILALDNGKIVTATPEMTSRYEPKVGDFWVIQKDGYIYINPAHVFLTKYSELKK